MKQYINEIFTIRAIACLSIVLLHSLNYAIDGYRESLSSIEFFSASGFGMLLYFGTPTFILISEILIANSYKHHIPKGFLTKRFKYIFVPYIVMAIFYAVVDIYLNELNFNFYTFTIESAKNIFLGDWHGYFILIIFQFYILHALLYNKLKIWSPSKVLIISFIINFIYLAFFRLTDPMNFIFADYIWERFHWMPIFGWLFYFFIAYYIGTNYNKFITYIMKKKYFLVVILAVSVAVMMCLTLTGVFTRTSKRPDMIFYTLSLVALLFLIASITKRIPKLLSMISRYSFGIYLVHIVFLTVLFQPHNMIPFPIYVVLTFIGSLAGSIFIIYTFNKINIGKFIVGKIGIKPKS